jgi:signal transduction histidine kinase
MSAVQDRLLRQRDRARRQLQVEKALDRIRKRALAIDTTADVGEVVEETRDALVELGITPEFTRILILEADGDTAVSWGAYRESGASRRGEFSVRRGRELDIPFLVPSKGRHRSTIVRVTKAQQRAQLRKFSRHLVDVGDVETLLFAHPMYQHIFAFRGGWISLTLAHELSTDEMALGRRIADAFGVTWRRLLEVQAAEKRTREAEIEAALERVRSQALSMQTSDDLPRVSATLFAEAQSLFDAVNTGLGVVDGTAGTIHEWLVVPDWPVLEKTAPWRLILEGDTRVAEIDYPASKWRRIHPFFRRAFRATCAGEPRRHVHVWNAELTAKVWDRLVEQGLWSRAYADAALDAMAATGIDALVQNLVQFDHGYFFVNTREPLSDERIAEIERFADVFDFAYGRFLELQQKETQNRELTIQNALEQVRARALGMQTSEELGSVTTILFEQFSGLGHDVHHTAIQIEQGSSGANALHTGQKTDSWWTGSHSQRDFLDQVMEPAPGSRLAQIKTEQERARKTGADWFVLEQEGEDLRRYRQELLEALGSPPQVAESLRRSPDRMVQHRVFHSRGYITFALVERLSDDDLAVAKRFTDVFDFAYGRFLELEQKESQNRELTIQNALERVRARALGMQTSNELSEVTSILFEQFRSLGHDLKHTVIHAQDGTATAHSLHARNGVGVWHTKGSGRTFLERITEPAAGSRFAAIDAEQKRVRESGSAWFVLDQEGEDLLRYRRELLEAQGSSETVAEILRRSPERMVQHRVFHSRGYISFGLVERLSDDDLAVAKRFTDVFDFAYGRFLELEQKERQNRELALENALERVRSHALAMQTTSDFPATAAAVFREADHLDFELLSCAIGIVHEEENRIDQWGAARNLSEKHMQLIRDRYSVFDEDPTVVREHFAISGLRQVHPYVERAFCVSPEQGEIAHVAAYMPATEMASWIDNMERLGIWDSEYAAAAPRYFPDEGTHISTFQFDYGYLWFYLTAPLESRQIDEAKRFAEVFEFAYGRFLELQSREQRAHQSQLEAAAERIRGAAMDMRSTHDLHRVVGVVRKQLLEFGFEEDRIASIQHHDPERDPHRVHAYFAFSNPRQRGHTWTSDTLVELDESTVASSWIYDYATRPELLANVLGDAVHREQGTPEAVEQHGRELWAPYGLDDLDALMRFSAPRHTHLTRVGFGIGTIGSRGDRYLTEEEIDILRAFGQALSLGLVRFRDFQELEDASTNKSQFLRRMSHDLRSPMNAIIGYSRLLRRRTAHRLNEREQRNLTNIETSSGNLLNLINDILDLSRIEAGRIEVNLQPVDIRILANECADALESIVQEGVTLKRNLADVGQIPTDPDRLRQVIMNLLGNATKFTETGSITLSLRAGRDSQVELAVADTGIGIPPDDLPHIFDEFRQVERQGGEQTEGTGLGLAIAKKTVDLLGGQLSATSEVGVGTTFTVRLDDQQA